MIENQGDIFAQAEADAICFTSNGIVKNNGELVMGAGIAKQFRDRYLQLATHFGTLVRRYGNHVHAYYAGSVHDRTIYSFPTKHHWSMPSDISLIFQSAKELLDKVNFDLRQKVYLTRPGCGLGGLEWDTVRKVIGPILDDRFTVLVPSG